MVNNEARCPICGLTASERQDPHRDASTFDCRRCGQFTMTGRLIRMLAGVLDPAGQQLRPYLSAYTKQTSAAGRRVVVDAETSADTENWRDAARAHAATPVSVKALKLLRLIEARSAFPGDFVTLDLAHDYPLLDPLNPAEMKYLLEHVDQRGYVAGVRGEPPRAYLTVQGWERLEPSTAGGTPGRCFVAMSFDPELDDAYLRGILPAVKQDCGLDPVRLKEVQHIEQITDRIIAEIRRAQFMVADFTGQRQGVYFEAGFAMGLGHPVIWMCRKGEVGLLHFDTRQYNHILWETPEDLRQQLADRIRALIPK